MWPIMFNFLRIYVPYITLPVAGIVGFIGYHLEDFLSDKYTPGTKSVKDQREDRLMEQAKEPGTLKERKFVPKTIFEKNLSPSLQDRN